MVWYASVELCICICACIFQCMYYVNMCVVTMYVGTLDSMHAFVFMY